MHRTQGGMVHLLTLTTTHTGTNHIRKLTLEQELIRRVVISTFRQALGNWGDMLDEHTVPSHCTLPPWNSGVQTTMEVREGHHSSSPFPPLLRPQTVSFLVRRVSWILARSAMQHCAS